MPTKSKLLRPAVVLLFGLSVVAMHQMVGSASAFAMRTDHSHHMVSAHCMGDSDDVTPGGEASNAALASAVCHVDDDLLPIHACSLDHSPCLGITTTTPDFIPALTVAKSVVVPTKLLTNGQLYVPIHPHPPNRAQLSIWRM